MSVEEHMEVIVETLKGGGLAAAHWTRRGWATLEIRGVTRDGAEFRAELELVSLNSNGQTADVAGQPR
jgi:hypothetical protein